MGPPWLTRAIRKHRQQDRRLAQGRTPELIGQSGAKIYLLRKL
jgi:hypothetical protein